MGRLSLSFERRPDAGSDGDTEEAAFFLPDEQSRRKLPEAIGTFYPRKVDTIELDRTPSQLLPSLIGVAQSRMILSSTEPRFEVPAEIVINSFSTSVECDHRSYSAQLVTARALAPKLASVSTASRIGC